jgi:hypothetical protein
MEYNEVTSTQDRADSLIYVGLKAFLAVVLMAALAVGGRDVMAASARRGTDRVSNISTAP